MRGLARCQILRGLRLCASKFRDALLGERALSPWAPHRVELFKPIKISLDRCERRKRGLCVLFVLQGLRDRSVRLFPLEPPRLVGLVDGELVLQFGAGRNQTLMFRLQSRARFRAEYANIGSNRGLFGDAFLDFAITDMREPRQLGVDARAGNSLKQFAAVFAVSAQKRSELALR